METQQGGIKWTTVVWAALLMFILPILISMIIPTVYGFYVGFSTRGDMAQVNAAIQGLGSSIFYQVLVYAAFAAVSLWRIYVLVKKVTDRRLLHAGIAVVIAALLVFAYYITASQGALAAVWDEVLIIAVMLAGGGYLGTLLKPGQTAQA